MAEKPTRKPTKDLSAHHSVGFIADDGPGCFVQWLAENPEASKQKVIKVAFALLRVSEHGRSRNG